MYPAIVCSAEHIGPAAENKPEMLKTGEKQDNLKRIAFLLNVWKLREMRFAFMKTGSKVNCHVLK